MMWPEPEAEAWQARYGTQAPAGMPELGAFLKHRSVRRYSGQAISEEVMRGLMAAAQSAATSSHLQLVTVVSVQDPETRAAVSMAVGNQQHVRDAAWFLAWIVDHHRLKQSAARRGLTTGASDYQDYFVVGLVDAALMAERLVCAAESIGIGSCYIGALRNDPGRIQELLGLPSGSFGAFGLCLGYPHHEEETSIKPRIAQENFWFREKYAIDVDTAEFDERMADVYAASGADPSVTWTQRSARRLSEGYLSGREGNKAFVESQGLDRR